MQDQLEDTTSIPSHIMIDQPAPSELSSSDDNSDKPHRYPFKLTSFERRIYNVSSVFENLIKVKSEYAKDPKTEQYFSGRREEQLSNRLSDSPSPHYRISYEKSMEQLSRDNRDCFGGDRVQRFLDMGCSPGGFSNWLLEQNPGAAGVGVTLPNENAQFKLVTDGTLLDAGRYQIIYADITTFATEAVSRGGNPLSYLSSDASDVDSEETQRQFVEQYDLILAGAFPTLEGFVPWWYRIQLALSQLLVVFTNLAHGGACIIVVKNKPFRWLVELTSILRTSFTTVTASKGSVILRSTCYIVCREFHSTPEHLETVTEKLRAALTKLQDVSVDTPPEHDNNDGYRNERSMPLLSSLSDEELFEQEHEFFLEVFEPQWLVQYNGIRKVQKRRT
ncbi:hypothetical protein EUX98_g3217 [Antrodiella citrinella]|uniref:Ribosomal RNA methyltransferase FtsJ domain-containing protein n=1 Tax=Antrodiella citrinella TaxID=2447956 RepID=A0A4S4MX26_9APHY|nr:hypothetical protein EUX98_g3217 [Antrodiella citrinella]